MITLMVDNYLSHEECDSLIKHYQKNIKSCLQFNGTFPLVLKNNEFLKLKERMNKTISLISNQELDYCQIVKWPENSFKSLHVDDTVLKTTYASVVYLNDVYEGGETTYKEGSVFKPKKGRLLLFNGQYYIHGVNKVIKKERYTLASWYRNKIG